MSSVTRFRVPLGFEPLVSLLVAIPEDWQTFVAEFRMPNPPLPGQRVLPGSTLIMVDGATFCLSGGPAKAGQAPEPPFDLLSGSVPETIELCSGFDNLSTTLTTRRATVLFLAKGRTPWTIFARRHAPHTDEAVEAAMFDLDLRTDATGRAMHHILTLTGKPDVDPGQSHLTSLLTRAHALDLEPIETNESETHAT